MWAKYFVVVVVLFREQGELVKRRKENKERNKPEITGRMHKETKCCR